MRPELAVPADDAELRRLLRENPMEGRVSLSLEREPSCALAATIEGHAHETVVVRGPDGRVQGMGSRAVLDAWVNGEPRRIGYLGQLRVDRSQPARLRMLAAGYRMLGELARRDPVALHVTTIVEDNRAARRLLEAGLPGLPRYRALARLVTLVVPVGRALGWGRGAGRAGRTEDRGRVVGGSSETAESIVGCLERNGRRHQLARRWTRADLACPERTRDLGWADFLVHDRGGRPDGCLAVWDQTRFKQTVVRGYAPGLARWRPLLNAVGPLFGQPALPPPGSPLRSAFVSHLAVDDDCAATAVALVDAAVRVARRRGIDHLALGLAERHPLLAPLRRAFPHRAYGSVLYRVDWDDPLAGAPPELDARVPHLEVATL